MNRIIGSSRCEILYMQTAFGMKHTVRHARRARSLERSDAPSLNSSAVGDRRSEK